jgi:hypothetical protein
MDTNNQTNQQPVLFVTYKEGAASKELPSSILNYIRKVYFNTLRSTSFIKRAEENRSKDLCTSIVESVFAGASIVLSVAKDNPYVVLGFSLYNELNEGKALIVHFTYVQSSVRGMGLMKSMLDPLLQLPQLSSFVYTFPRNINKEKYSFWEKAERVKLPVNRKPKTQPREVKSNDN